MTGIFCRYANLQYELKKNVLEEEETLFLTKQSCKHLAYFSHIKIHFDP